MRTTFVLLTAIFLGLLIGTFWARDFSLNSPELENRPALTINPVQPSPTPSVPVLVEPGDNSRPFAINQKRDLIDKIGLLSTFASVIALLFIQKQISQGSANSRVEFLPYVRVDIGPDDTSLDQSNFKPGRATPPGYTDDDVAAYYEDERQAIDLTNGDATSRVFFSAWFRNYQEHSLGQAYSLSAFFQVEFADSSSDDEVPFVGVEIGYLEHGKPVKINLCALPSGRAATIRLYELEYADVQNHHYRHSRWDQRAQNATHGRFACVYDGQHSRSVPESWTEHERTFIDKVIESIRGSWEFVSDTMRR